MRKLVLLSSVFMLSFGAFAQNNVFAIGGAGQATEGTQKEVLETNRVIIDYIKRAAEQATATAAEETDAAATIANAASANARTGVQQGAIANTLMETSNSAAALCVMASASRANAAIDENARTTIAAIRQDQMAIVNQDAGTFAENGFVDSRIQLIDMIGEDNSHTDLGAILHRESISPQEAQGFLAPILAFTQAALNIPESILARTDTNAKIVVGEAKQLQTLNSVALALYHSAIEGKIAYQGTPATQYLKERMKVGGGWTDEALNETYKDGLSREGYFKGLTFGSDNPTMTMQRFNGSISDLLKEVAHQLIVSNELAFENLKRLNAQNMAMAANIALELEPAREKLDRDIEVLTSAN